MRWRSGLVPTTKVSRLRSSSYLLEYAGRIGTEAGIGSVLVWQAADHVPSHTCHPRCRRQGWL